MEGHGRADVGRDGQQAACRAGSRSACGRLDDEVLLALAAEVGVGQAQERQPGADRVGGDGLVAEVEADPAGPAAG